MRWKTTVFLLVTTVAVGAYVSLYEIRQPSREERERLSQQVVDVQPDTVTQLVLDLPEVKVTLTQSGATWRLSPNGVRADGTLVTRLLNQLASLRAERILSGAPGKPLDPKSFGLDPAIGRLSVVAQGTPTTLLIGETTPVKGKRYVRVGGRSEIFVVPDRLFEEANQPVEQFRDSLLMRFNTWQAEGLVVTSAAHACTLTRRDNRWQLSAVPGASPGGLTQPLEDLADRSEVNALLSSLAGLTVKRFLNDAPQVESAPAWGFDAPKAEVTLRQSGESPVTLFFGKPLPEDPSLVYAKRNDEPSISAVAAADVESLLRDPHGLRAKSCFEFFTGQVAKLEVLREGTRWTIARQDGAWKAEGADAALDAQRVEALLNEVADLRVGGFVEDVPSDLARYGLEPPRGTITVWTSDQEQPQRLLVGDPIEPSASRYGRIEGRPAVVRLPEAVMTLLAKTPDQLRSPAPQPAAASASPASSAPSPQPLHSASQKN